MALGFNSNLFNTNTQSSSRSSETAGVVASAETAGSLAAASTETAGLIASAGQIDSFESSNPFAPQIDYSQYSSVETAGSLACETAGVVAFGDCETAGSIASAGTETAGSVAFSDSGSFGSFDSGFVC